LGEKMVFCFELYYRFLMTAAVSGGEMMLREILAEQRKRRVTKKEKQS
jgi:hypothetical protein